MAQRDLADLRAVEGQGFGGAHGLESSNAAIFWSDWPIALLKLALAATKNVANFFKKCL